MDHQIILNVQYIPIFFITHINDRIFLCVCTDNKLELPCMKINSVISKKECFHNSRMVYILKSYHINCLKIIFTYV